ncbi:MAG: hypothetical protein HY719_01735 [Planctomycetes bacterium]|nr:hypothetical protein [Planctomycetota bacterium]
MTQSPVSRVVLFFRAAASGAALVLLTGIGGGPAPVAGLTPVARGEDQAPPPAAVPKQESAPTPPPAAKKKPAVKPTDDPNNPDEDPNQPPDPKGAAEPPAGERAVGEAERGSPLYAAGHVDYRGVLHAHSFLSHDSSGTRRKIIAAAGETGLDFLMMTDHPNNPESVTRGLTGWHGRTLFTAGEEKGVSGGGSLMAIDLARRVRGKGLQEQIDDTVAQGGQAWICHAESWKEWDFPGLTGIEVYNLHYDALLDGKMFIVLAAASKWLKTDPDRAFKQILDRPDPILKKWDQVTRKRRFPAVAGNDSHENVVFAGVQMDPYPRSFRFVNTHVFVKGRLTRSNLREALAEGRAYICHEMFGDGFGFSFTASRPSGEAVSPGEETTFGPGMALRVTAPKKARVTLIRDGETVAESEGETADCSWPVVDPGVYRVELTIRDPKDDDKVRPWIYSNPIYLRPPGWTPAPRTPPAAGGGEEF